MAGRSVKKGISEFSLDCQDDERIRLIQAEYGLEGFAVVIKLYQKIYGEYGYYCKWDKDSSLLFCLENGMQREDDRQTVFQIVEACVQRGIFSDVLYQKYGVLTSAEIQKQYLKVVQRRDTVALIEEFLLIDLPAGPSSISTFSLLGRKKSDCNFNNVNIFEENADINEENVYINAKNADINEKAPEKERKKEKGEKDEEKKAKKSDIKESKEIEEKEYLKEINKEKYNNPPLAKTPPTEKTENKLPSGAKRKGPGNKIHFDDAKLDQAFTDFRQMRQRIHKPMTDRAEMLAVNKLVKLSTPSGADYFDANLAVRILEQSVFNSWQGLFPLREDKTYSPHNSSAEALAESYRMMDEWADQGEESFNDDS